jgi:hypothetical protein
MGGVLSGLPKPGEMWCKKERLLLPPGYNIFSCFLTTCFISVVREVIMWKRGSLLQRAEPHVSKSYFWRWCPCEKATSCTQSGCSGTKEERSCGSPSAAAVTQHHIVMAECCGGYLYLSGGRVLWRLPLLIRRFKGSISAQMWRAEEVERVLLTLGSGRPCSVW